MTSINWFEIPTVDFDRAVGFYEAVLATKLRQETFGGMRTAIFPYDEPGTGGSLVANPRLEPSASGTVVYLAADGKLEACLSRIEAAGGKVLVPKTDIGDPGFIGVFRDTEGNVVGIHSHR